MSGLHGRWSLGALAGAGIGALGVWVGLSLAWQLTILGAVVLAGAPFTRVLYPSDEHEDAAGRAAAAGARTWTRSTVLSVLLLGGLAMASFLAEGAAADWSAVYLRNSVGAAAVVASLGYAVYSFATVTVRLLADRAFARADQSKVVSSLAVVATLGFLAALITEQLAVAVVGLMCLGAGLATVVPSMFSAAGRLPNLPPSTGIATVTAFGWAGFVCGPPLIGGIASVSSLPWALGVVPVLTTFIAVGSRVALRRPSRPIGC
jgi:sugar phosphate permease